MTEVYAQSCYSSLHNRPNCIDLFSGAGGLSLGFLQAGGSPVAAVDWDVDSITTYKRMFPVCEEVYCGDIEEWAPSSVKSDIDVMIGGPPCQGFSLARGFRFVDDPRNHLYKQFIRLVDLFRPLWFVMENVEGITNIGNGVILQQIYEDFDAIGYWVDHRVINMADYSVPQTRKRAIFVGSRVNGQRFTWPQKSCHSLKRGQQSLFSGLTPYTSVNQALGDLPWPRGNYFSHRANSQMRGPRNRFADTDPAFTLRIRGDEFALCEEPAQGAFVPGPVPDMDLSYAPATHPIQTLMREEPPPWIEGYQFPPCIDTPAPELTGTRRLAIREQARLQTFPDWFSFSGRAYAQGRQVGNAVPPLFAKQLFRAVFRHISQAKGIKDKGSRMSEGVNEPNSIIIR